MEDPDDLLINALHGKLVDVVYRYPVDTEYRKTSCRVLGRFSILDAVTRCIVKDCIHNGGDAARLQPIESSKYPTEELFTLMQQETDHNILNALHFEIGRAHV